MGTKRYTITPLCVGTLTGDMGQMVWGHEFGVKREIPVLMFYVEGGGKHIMVDTRLIVLRKVQEEHARSRPRSTTAPSFAGPNRSRRVHLRASA
ncbi:hypothetical protein ACFLUT_04340 [Chloroflexota bacterium]